MTWRVAYSLDTLLRQLNILFPQRDKSADGAIGDAAHSSRESDHNPDEYGVVRARDFTHDPDGGLNCAWLANKLVQYRDPRIKYVIWDRHIWTPATGWRAYYGPNPHTKHLHLSVVADGRADVGSNWTLGGFMSELSAVEQRNLYNRVFGMLDQRYYTLDKDGVAHECSATTPGKHVARVLDTLDGNFLVQQNKALLELVEKQGEELAAIRVYIEGLQ